MRTTLLLVPGILNDAGLWDEVAAQLQPLADVRRVPVLAQETIADMADAAWALLADLPVDAPVVLAGFSLGGYVAIEMLARPARRLRAAALISTSARTETPDSQAAREATMANMRRDFARVVDGILKFATHQADAEVSERLRQMMLRIGADTAIRQNRATMGRADHRTALGRLSLPVAVLCGCEDRVTPPALAEELAALIPDARLQLIEGSGHMLPAEGPTALADALRPLLA